MKLSKTFRPDNFGLYRFLKSQLNDDFKVHNSFQQFTIILLNQ